MPDIKAYLDYGVAICFAAILLATFLRQQGKLVRVMETQAVTLAKLTTLVEAHARDFATHRAICERLHGDSWHPIVEGPTNERTS